MKNRNGVFLFLPLVILVLTTFAGRPAEASEPGTSPDPSELQPPSDYTPTDSSTRPSFWDQYGVITILAAILISTSIIVATIQYSKNKSR